MGGATHFNKNKKKWNRIFSNIVNGQVKNVFSKADRILLLYSVSELDFKAAGRHRIKLGEEDPDEVVENYDITKNIVSEKLEGMGHTNYMKFTNSIEIYANIDLK